MNKAYDAIIVGARCAGSPTAMLLARKGYRVLRGGPRDVPQRHRVDARGAAARGGRAREVGTARSPRRPPRCPPIHTFAFDFGPFTISGAPGTADAPVAYCPRRIVLDKLLVDAAGEAGAEVREGFTVEDVLVEDGRVVGIRGRSKAGGTVDRARRSRHRRRRLALHRRRGRPARTVPRETAAARLVLQLLERSADRRAVRDLHPSAPRLRGGPDPRRSDAHRRGLAVRGVRGEQARRRGQLLDDAGARARVRGAACRARSARHGSPARACRTIFHKPYGPGWVLVGDAGYIKDAITAQGINDAFRDAERCAIALDETFSGARSFDEAMGGYQRDRDEHVRPMYEFTCQLATLEPPPPEMQQLFAAIHGNQEGHGRVRADECRDDLAGTVLLAGAYRRDHGRRADRNVTTVKENSFSRRGGMHERIRDDPSSRLPASRASGPPPPRAFRSSAGARSAAQEAGIDDWIKEVKGTHRCFFDFPQHKNGLPQLHILNYLNTYSAAYKVGPGQAGAVGTFYGMGSQSSIPFAFN